MKIEDIENKVLQVIDNAIEVAKIDLDNYIIEINLHDITPEGIERIKAHCTDKGYLLKERKGEKTIKIGCIKKHVQFCGPVTIYT